jgi:hypothetical protein
MEEFIIWERRDTTSAERQSYTEIVKAVCNSQADKEYFYANKDRLFRQYIAAMAYPLMCLRFGMNYRELPDEQTDPVLHNFTKRLAWQINEISEFIIYCFQILPGALNKDPIKIQSNQYEEELPREKTQGEMIDIMAQELSNLPRFHAHAKIIKEQYGKQSVWKGLIETNPLFGENLKNNEKEIAERSSRFCTRREAVEQQIRKRQEQWLRKQQASETPQSLRVAKPPPTSD